jgi:heptosyltransferase II
LRVLLVHLGAMGAVCRSTALLAPIHKKYPGCHLTWVVDRPSDQLLKDHPLIDRVLTSSHEDILSLAALEFDVAFVLDKSLKASGILKITHADLVYGFKANEQTGAIEPANPEANELWEIGLSDHKKFFENTKSELQLTFEALDLGVYSKPEYSLLLTEAETQRAKSRRSQWALGNQIVLGINTGCSNTIPYKKLSVDLTRRLLDRFCGDDRLRVVLLGGGPDDQLQNQRIGYGRNIIQSPTNLGLRDGLVSVAACDLVISGDSLGMHLAVAMKKWVVAWFGPTCAHEIELFGRGEKVLSSAPCSPCWKRSCDKPVMCYDQVAVEDIYRGVENGIRWQTEQNVERNIDFANKAERSGAKVGGDPIIDVAVEINSGV